EFALPWMLPIKRKFLPRASFFSRRALSSQCPIGRRASADRLAASQFGEMASSQLRRINMLSKDAARPARSWTPIILIMGGMIAMSPTTKAESPEATAKQTTVKPLGATGDNAIRPFHFKASEKDLVDLRQRVAATRWPER